MNIFQLQLIRLKTFSLLQAWPHVDTNCYSTLVAKGRIGRIAAAPSE